MTEYEMMKAKNSKREIKTPSIPLFLFENYTVRIIITTCLVSSKMNNNNKIEFKSNFFFLLWCRGFNFPF